jgi:hypothetical protein
MSKILKVTANDDYTLLVEFEGNNKIYFDMKELIQTMPYHSLNDPECFKDFTLEERAIRWKDVGRPELAMRPVRLTVDDILFTIRE